MNKISISESHTVQASAEIIELIKRTAPLREYGLYLTELREWRELPFYKRIFTRKPQR